MKELVKQVDALNRDVEKLKSLQDAGASSGVTAVTGTAPIASSGGTTPAISLANSGVTPGSYTNAAFTVDIHGLVSAASSGSAPVTAVTGSAPVTSSGGATPAIGIAITTTNDGGAIVKQASYPGSQQASANINVAGSINAGTTFYKGGVEWMGSGTSFPGSPSTNQRYFRTDRGLEYYYDGTRWVTVSQFHYPLASRGGTQPFTAAQTIFDCVIPGIGTNGALIEALAIKFLAATVSQSATNYYSWQGFSNKAAGALTTITGMSGDTKTATATPGTAWYYLGNSSLGFVLTNANFDVQVNVTPNGAPGTFYMALAIEYRLIG